MRPTIILLVSFLFFTGYINDIHAQVLEENVRDPWGTLADKVSGQLILESVDGTKYTIDDYIFFATKDETTREYLPDDRENDYGSGSIMGAFPSKEPYGDNLPSLPYAIAEKYKSDALGLGIVSDCLDNIKEDWASLKSYLQIGIDPDISNELNWRTDVPNWSSDETGFYPEAVPGFKIKIHFPDVEESIETADGLMCTVDTGAPDLTLRLGSTDPQNQTAFSSHFVNSGPWENWNDDYRTAAKTLINASVTVEFTDSDGEKNSYTLVLLLSGGLLPVFLLALGHFCRTLYKPRYGRNSFQSEGLLGGRNDIQLGRVLLEAVPGPIFFQLERPFFEVAHEP